MIVPRIAACVLAVGGVGFQSHASDGVAARLQTIAGESIEAELVGIGADGRVRYRSGGRAAEIALDDLSNISIPHDAPAITPAAGDDAPAIHTIHLADGGCMTGRILDAAPGADPRSLRFDVGLARPLGLPLSAVAAVRFARTEDAAAERELQARLAARPAAHDLLIVARGDAPTVLSGALERLTAREWEFRFGDSVRSAPLSRAYAVVLGVGTAAAAPGPASIRLAGGHRFTTRVVSADGAELRLDGGPLGALSLPWSAVESVALRSGRIVYLSEMTPASMSVRTAFDADWPVQRDRNVTGGPIRLAGRPYARGLGVHARTVLTYALDGEFERFQATVGVDDGVAPHGSVVFRVRADGRTVFTSPTLRGGGPTERVDIDVSGARVLTLECDDDVDLDLSDHGNWADARLIRAKTEPQDRARAQG